MRQPLLLVLPQKAPTFLEVQSETTHRVFRGDQRGEVRRLPPLEKREPHLRAGSQNKGGTTELLIMSPHYINSALLLNRHNDTPWLGVRAGFLWYCSSSGCQLGGLINRASGGQVNRTSHNFRKTGSLPCWLSHQQSAILAWCTFETTRKHTAYQGIAANS